jgi:uncharacterized repeat protein (TIGR01451 family)
MARMGGGPDYLGHLSGTGFLIPNADNMDMFFADYVYPPGAPGLDFSNLLTICERDIVLDGRDIMFWVVHITMDSSYDLIGPYSGWCVDAGLIEVINGTIAGGYAKNNDQIGMFQDSLLAGTFVSNMAAQAGRAIEARFIEPDGITVKQLPMNVDLGITKTSDVSTPEDEHPVLIGDPVTFTITVTNNGPSDATSIWVWDNLPAGLNLQSWSATQGWYYVGTGRWSVGDLADGEFAELEIVATVNTVGRICNPAVINSVDQHDPITNNNAVVLCVYGEALEAVTQTTVLLREGFNLISLPLIPDNSDIEAMTLGISANFGGVTMYDTSTGWHAYAGGTPTPPFTTMEDGIGYWVTMTAGPPNLTFSGEELVASPSVLPPSYDMVEGWNLIGFKSTVPKLPEEYLAGIAGQYVMIYGYDDGFFIAGAPGHEMFQPGLGYWLAMKTGESGTVFP